MIGEVARSYVGTPFAHKGRAPGTGLDCAGVIFCAAWACGIQIPDFLDYGRLPDERLFRELRKRAEPARDGADFALFHDGNGHAMHFAALDGDRMVHATERHGRVIVQPLRGAWRARLHSTWRLAWHP